MNAQALFWRGYTEVQRGMRKLYREEKGQDFLEYIIIVGFALLVVAAVAALYGAINGKFLDAAAAIQGIHF